MRAAPFEPMPEPLSRPAPRLDLSQIFPIRDPASARFMQFKAHCLLRAGIISRAQKAEVDAAAARALTPAVGCAGPRAPRRAACH